MLIKQNGIDQKKLSGYLDIPVGTLRAWIHYQRIPDVESAIIMARVLGVTLDYLVNGKVADTEEDEKKARNAVKKAAFSIRDYNDRIRDNLLLIGRQYG